ncbi:MAG: hypothetical protein AAF743_16505, partial [Planctomycetota bacterium]
CVGVAGGCSARQPSLTSHKELPMKRIFSSFAALIVAAVTCGPLMTTNQVDAGLTGGPDFAVDVVAAYDTHIYELVFDPHTTALLEVIGDGYTDLDVYVYDGQGRLLTFEDGDSDRVLLGWTPAYYDVFRIEIVNRGNTWNEYTIATN